MVNTETNAENRYTGDRVGDSGANICGEDGPPLSRIRP